MFDFYLQSIRAARDLLSVCQGDHGCQSSTVMLSRPRLFTSGPNVVPVKMGLRLFYHIRQVGRGLGRCSVDFASHGENMSPFAKFVGKEHICCLFSRHQSHLSLLIVNQLSKRLCGARTINLFSHQSRDAFIVNVFVQQCKQRRLLRIWHFARYIS